MYSVACGLSTALCWGVRIRHSMAASACLPTPGIEQTHVVLHWKQTTLEGSVNQNSIVSAVWSGNIYAAADSTRSVCEIAATDGGHPTSPAIFELSSGFGGPEGLVVDLSPVIFDCAVEGSFHNKKRSTSNLALSGRQC